MSQEGIEKISAKEFSQLTEFIRRNYGISLGEEKKTLVVGRLGNLLAQNNFNSFSEYLEHVMSDTTGTAIATLMDKITTNHTYFMREADHFDFFRNKILPFWESRITDRDLRIWSAGCSSGEEPYTLAMIVNEYFGKEKFKWNTRILATDISTHVLEIAKQAEYTDEQLEVIRREWRLGYFRKTARDKNVVVDHIKNEVLFRRFNLMEQVFPFKKKFHTIFCRNVMIYFDIETKRELIKKFYEATEPGGYLFIGHSESLNNIQAGYKYMLPAVYRKE